MIWKFGGFTGICLLFHLIPTGDYTRALLVGSTSHPNPQTPLQRKFLVLRDILPVSTSRYLQRVCFLFEIPARLKSKREPLNPHITVFFFFKLFYLPPMDHHQHHTRHDDDGNWWANVKLCIWIEFQFVRDVENWGTLIDKFLEGNRITNKNTKRRVSSANLKWNAGSAHPTTAPPPYPLPPLIAGERDSLS